MVGTLIVKHALKSIGFLIVLSVALAALPKNKDISIFDLEKCLGYTRKNILSNKKSRCFVAENQFIQILDNKAQVHVYFESNVPKIFMMFFMEKDVRLKEKSEVLEFRKKFQELESKINGLMEPRSIASHRKPKNEFIPENCVQSDNGILEATVWEYKGIKFNLFMACASEDFVKKERGVLNLQLRIEKR